VRRGGIVPIHLDFHARRDNPSSTRFPTKKGVVSVQRMLTVFFIFGLFLLTTLGFNVARVCSSATTTLENERVFEASLQQTCAANMMSRMMTMHCQRQQ
jgi:hypothetical protein